MGVGGWPGFPPVSIRTTSRAETATARARRASARGTPFFGKVGPGCRRGPSDYPQGRVSGFIKACSEAGESGRKGAAALLPERVQSGDDKEDVMAVEREALRDWHRLFGLLLTDFFTGSPFTVEVERDLSAQHHGIATRRLIPGWSDWRRRRWVRTNGEWRAATTSSAICCRPGETRKAAARHRRDQRRTTGLSPPAKKMQPTVIAALSRGTFC
jgi:hypothetical protein